MEEIIKAIKEVHLDSLAEYRKELCRKPVLKQFFLELTSNCNEHCFHCGSRCETERKSDMPVSEFKKVLDEVKENFDISDMMLCITGGEPLLYKDFFELMGYANSLGYRWGMTSNGTLITKEIAEKLRECGMKTISISIDGLEETHDRLRQTKGGYRRAIRGIKNLIETGGFQHIQVTTVVNHENISELDTLYTELDKLDIDSWRVIGIEPIGRALDFPEKLLTKDDQIKMFNFIKEKRKEMIPVTYGCSHFLGLDYEREVREWYFLCNAGIYTASIMSNGDIGACLDIERRHETIQGNIKTDSFTDVWKNRFEIFRKPLSEKCEKCRGCHEEKWCRGGSYHSWDYDRNEPMICMKGVLF